MIDDITNEGSDNVCVRDDIDRRVGAGSLHCRSAAGDSSRPIVADQDIRSF